MHRGFTAVPRFIRRDTIQAPRRRVVQEIHRRPHSLAPEQRWHGHALHHTTRHLHHRLVSTLNHPILLWGVQCGGEVLDATLLTVASELGGVELAATIRPESK